eukprot:TRINITY_DN1177_c0_g1_i4.p1 TRINITY_DN1177_c0_g1~~TRINITY_DN1177_c0_g1_i4.p1  ORF type:complete len:4726 (-),score=1175.89 TRINITY_DN1177_c0_g1_i4:213-14390(-)
MEDKGDSFFQDILQSEWTEETCRRVASNLERARYWVGHVSAIPSRSMDAVKRFAQESSAVVQPPVLLWFTFVERCVEVSRMIGDDPDIMITSFCRYFHTLRSEVIPELLLNFSLEAFRSKWLPEKYRLDALERVVDWQYDATHFEFIARKLSGMSLSLSHAPENDLFGDKFVKNIIHYQHKKISDKFRSLIAGLCILMRIFDGKFDPMIEPWVSMMREFKTTYTDYMQFVQIEKPDVKYGNTWNWSLEEKVILGMRENEQELFEESVVLRPYDRPIVTLEDHKMVLDGTSILIGLLRNKSQDASRINDELKMFGDGSYFRLLLDKTNEVMDSQHVQEGVEAILKSMEGKWSSSELERSSVDDVLSALKLFPRHLDKPLVLDYPLWIPAACGPATIRDRLSSMHACIRQSVDWLYQGEIRFVLAKTFIHIEQCRDFVLSPELSSGYHAVYCAFIDNFDRIYHFLKLLMWLINKTHIHEKYGTFLKGLISRVKESNPLWKWRTPEDIACSLSDFNRMSTSLFKNMSDLVSGNDNIFRMWCMMAENGFPESLLVLLPTPVGNVGRSIMVALKTLHSIVAGTDEQQPDLTKFEGNIDVLKELKTLCLHWHVSGTITPILEAGASRGAYTIARRALDYPRLFFEYVRNLPGHVRNYNGEPPLLVERIVKIIRVSQLRCLIADFKMEGMKLREDCILEVWRKEVQEKDQEKRSGFGIDYAIAMFNAIGNEIERPGHSDEQVYMSCCSLLDADFDPDDIWDDLIPLLNIFTFVLRERELITIMVHELRMSGSFRNSLRRLKVLEETAGINTYHLLQAARLVLAFLTYYPGVEVTRDFSGFLFYIRTVFSVSSKEIETLENVFCKNPVSVSGEFSPLVSLLEEISTIDLNILQSQMAAYIEGTLEVELLVSDGSNIAVFRTIEEQKAIMAEKDAETDAKTDSKKDVETDSKKERRTLEYVEGVIEMCGDICFRRNITDSRRRTWEKQTKIIHEIIFLRSQIVVAHLAGHPEYRSNIISVDLSDIDIREHSNEIARKTSEWKKNLASTDILHLKPSEIICLDDAIAKKNIDALVMFCRAYFNADSSSEKVMHALKEVGRDTFRDDQGLQRCESFLKYLGVAKHWENMSVNFPEKLMESDLVSARNSAIVGLDCARLSFTNTFSVLRYLYGRTLKNFALHPFELLWCSKGTQPIEILTFLERVKNFGSKNALFTIVNPYLLQLRDIATLKEGLSKIHHQSQCGKHPCVIILCTGFWNAKHEPEEQQMKRMAKIAPISSSFPWLNEDDVFCMWERKLKPSVEHCMTTHDLQEFWANKRIGPSALKLVVGDSGSGKSQFLTEMGGRHRYSYSEKIPFSWIAEALNETGVDDHSHCIHTSWDISIESMEHVFGSILLTGSLFDWVKREVYSFSVSENDFQKEKSRPKLFIEMPTQCARKVREHATSIRMNELRHSESSSVFSIFSDDHFVECPVQEFDCEFNTKDAAAFFAAPVSVLESEDEDRISTDFIIRNLGLTWTASVSDQIQQFFDKQCRTKGLPATTLSYMEKKLFLHYLQPSCKILSENDFLSAAKNVEGGRKEFLELVKESAFDRIVEERRKDFGNMLHAIVCEVNDRTTLGFCHNGIPDGEEYDLLRDRLKKGLRGYGCTDLSKGDRSPEEILNECETILGNVVNLTETLTKDILKREKYILTYDFLYRLYWLFSMMESNVATMLSGQTGVGKTYMTSLLAFLLRAKHMLEFVKPLKRDACPKDEIEDINSRRPGRIMEILNRQVLLFQDEVLKTFDDLVECHRKVVLRTILRFIGLLENDDMETDVLHVAQNSAESGRIIFAEKDKVDERSSCKEEIIHLLHHSFLETSELEKDLKNLRGGINDATMKDVLKRVLRAEARSFFFKLTMHADMGMKEIFDHVNRCVDLAKRFPSVRLILFIDEINTSSHIGYLHDIVVSKILVHPSGDTAVIHIPANVSIVGALNDLEDTLQDENPETSALERARGIGAQIPGGYDVRDMPKSVRLLLWDFGKVRERDEKTYLNALFEKSRDKISEFFIDSSVKQRIVNTLANCQKLSRELDGGNYAVVSQRDFQRFFTFLEFFNKWKVIRQENETFHRSDNHYITLALCLCYYFRLSSSPTQSSDDKKKEMLKTIEDSIGLDPGCGKNFLKDELSLLTGGSDSPFGEFIIPNRMIRENLYVLLLCIATKIPVMVIGVPGSSKTLSFQTLREELAKNRTKTSFLSKDVFPSIDTTPFQCTKFTTASQIHNLLENATIRQKERGPTDDLTCVFIDEANIPGVESESMKALHSFADDHVISIVMVANVGFDYAKMNRAVVIHRETPSASDTIDIIRKLSGKDEFLVKKIGKRYSAYMYNFNAEHVTKYQLGRGKFITPQKLFGLRDLYHWCIDMSSPLLGEKITLGNLFERNFGGVWEKDLKNIVRHFTGFMSDQMQGINLLGQIECMKLALQRLPVLNLTDRFTLVIDDTRCHGALNMLKMSGVIPSNAQVIYGSHFGRDQRGLRPPIVLKKFKAAVQMGEENHCIVLVECGSIFENLYDFLNKVFKSTGVGYTVRINDGLRSDPLTVCGSLRLIIVVSADEIHDLPVPFLNRLEKRLISEDAYDRLIAPNVIREVDRCLKDLFSFSDPLCEQVRRAFRPVLFRTCTRLNLGLYAQAERGVIANDNELKRIFQNALPKLLDMLSPVHVALIVPKLPPVYGANFFSRDAITSLRSFFTPSDDDCLTEPDIKIGVICGANRIDSSSIYHGSIKFLDVSHYSSIFDFRGAFYDVLGVGHEGRDADKKVIVIHLENDENMGKMLQMIVQLEDEIRRPLRLRRTIRCIVEPRGDKIDEVLGGVEAWKSLLPCAYFPFCAELQPLPFDHFEGTRIDGLLIARPLDEHIFGREIDFDEFGENSNNILLYILGLLSERIALAKPDVKFSIPFKFDKMKTCIESLFDRRPRKVDNLSLWSIVAFVCGGEHRLLPKIMSDFHDTIQNFNFGDIYEKTGVLNMRLEKFIEVKEMAWRHVLEEVASHVFDECFESLESWKLLTMWLDSMTTMKEKNDILHAIEFFWESFDNSKVKDLVACCGEYSLIPPFPLIEEISEEIFRNIVISRKYDTWFDSLGDGSRCPSLLKLLKKTESWKIFWEWKNRPSFDKQCGVILQNLQKKLWKSHVELVGRSDDDTFKQPLLNGMEDMRMGDERSLSHGLVIVDRNMHFAVQALGLFPHYAKKWHESSLAWRETANRIVELHNPKRGKSRIFGLSLWSLQQFSRLFEELREEDFDGYYDSYTRCFTLLKDCSDHDLEEQHKHALVRLCRWGFFMSFLRKNHSVFMECNTSELRKCFDGSEEKGVARLLLLGCAMWKRCNKKFVHLSIELNEIFKIMFESLFDHWRNHCRELGFERRAGTSDEEAWVHFFADGKIESNLFHHSTPNVDKGLEVFQSFSIALYLFKEAPALIETINVENAEFRKLILEKEITSLLTSIRMNRGKSASAFIAQFLQFVEERKCISATEDEKKVAIQKALLSLIADHLDMNGDDDAGDDVLDILCDRRKSRGKLATLMHQIRDETLISSILSTHGLQGMKTLYHWEHSSVIFNESVVERLRPCFSEDVSFDLEPYHFDYCFSASPETEFQALRVRMLEILSKDDEKDLTAFANEMSMKGGEDRLTTLMYMFTIIFDHVHCAHPGDERNLRQRQCEKLVDKLHSSLSGFLDDKRYKLFKCFSNFEKHAKFGVEGLPSEIAKDRDSAKTGKDPFYRMFHCDSYKDNRNIVHLLSNVMAIAVGLPDKSSHFWTYMLDTTPIRECGLGWVGDYYTCAGGFHYDCGSELDWNGTTPADRYPHHRAPFTPLSLLFSHLVSWGSIGTGFLIDEDYGRNMIGDRLVFSTWLFVRKFATELCQICAKYLGINLNGDARAMFAVTQGLWNIRKVLIQPGQKEVKYHERVTKTQETQLFQYERFLVNKFQDAVAGIDGCITRRTEAYRQSVKGDLMSLWDQSAEKRKCLALPEKTIVARIMTEAAQHAPVLFRSMGGDTFVAISDFCSKSYPIVLSASDNLHKHVDYCYDWEVGGKPWDLFISSKGVPSMREEMQSVCSLYSKFVDTIATVRICGAGGDNKLFPITEETTILNLLNVEGDGGGHVDGDALCHIVRFTEKWHGEPLRNLGKQECTAFMIDCEHHSRDRDIFTSHDTLEFPVFLGDISKGMSVESDPVRNWILSRVKPGLCDGPDLRKEISRALVSMEVSLARMCAFGRTPILDEQMRGALVHPVATKVKLKDLTVLEEVTTSDRNSTIEKSLMALSFAIGGGETISREILVALKKKFLLKVHRIPPKETSDFVNVLVPLSLGQNAVDIRQAVERFCMDQKIGIDLKDDREVFEFAYIFIWRYWIGYHEYFHVPSLRCECLTVEEENVLDNLFSCVREDAERIGCYMDIMSSLERAMMSPTLNMEMPDDGSGQKKLMPLWIVVVNDYFTEHCPDITVDKVGSVVHWLKFLEFSRIRFAIPKTDLRVVVKTNVDLSPAAGHCASISESRARRAKSQLDIRETNEEEGIFSWKGRTFSLNESQPLRDLYYLCLCEWKKNGGTLPFQQKILFDMNSSHRLFFLVDGGFAPKVCNAIALVVMEHFKLLTLPEWRCFVHKITRKEDSKFQRFVVVFPHVMVKPDQMRGVLDEIDDNEYLSCHTFNWSIYKEKWIPLFIEKPCSGDWKLKIFKSDSGEKEKEAFDLLDVLVETCPMQFHRKRRDERDRCFELL